MTVDLRAELRRAAGSLPELDEATFRRVSGRRHRPDGRSVVAGLAALAVTVAVAGLLMRPGSEVQFTPSEGGNSGEAETVKPAAVAAYLSDVEWEVLAAGVSHVWSLMGKVVTDQAGLDRQWEAFEADGLAPALPSEMGALILPVAGTCEDSADIHGLQGILNTQGTRAHAAVQVDPACAAELPGRGSVHPPPHTLYVIAVAVDVAERLAGVVAVTGSVADFDWEVLAIGATSDATVPGLVVSDDFRALDVDWRRFGQPGSPPALPAERGAFLVVVPGNCDSADQLRSVRAVATEQPHEPLLGAVNFDLTCVVLTEGDSRSPTPGTLYVIAVPLEVAKSVGGTRVFIACDEAHQTGAGCGEPTDRAVPPPQPNYPQ